MLKAIALIAAAYFFLPVIMCLIERVYYLLSLIPQLF
jgi:hypothetical protein